MAVEVLLQGPPDNAHCKNQHHKTESTVVRVMVNKSNAMSPEVLPVHNAQPALGRGQEDVEHGVELWLVFEHYRAYARKTRLVLEAAQLID